jgi:hypothetical protein
MKSIFIRSLACICAFSVSGGSMHAQSRGRTADIAVRDLSFHTPVSSALQMIAKQYRIVIGDYGDIREREASLKPFPVLIASFKNAKLRDVFNAAVKADPGYTWEETSRGAIHFILRPKPSLFDVKIATFQNSNLDEQTAIPSVAMIPEVAMWLSAHECRFGTSVVRAGGRPLPWPRNVSVMLKKAPFTDVLDEIAAKSQKYYWSAFEVRAIEGCLIDIGVA